MMIDEIRTFTYLPLACDRDKQNHEELRESWDGYRCCDVLELFVSNEDQVDGTDYIWDGDWECWMDRITPVQMTLGWDARTYLVEILKQAGFEPTYEIGRLGESTILYYDHVPTIEAYKTAIATIPVDNMENPQDRTRFDEVIRATLELADRQQRGLVFAWAWGFDYEVNGHHLDYPEIRAGLKKHGLKFFTRHA